MKNLKEALKKGNSLDNPDRWAKATATGTILTTVTISGISLYRAFGGQIDFDSDALKDAAIFVGVLWMTITEMIHVAINKEIGKDE